MKLIVDNICKKFEGKVVLDHASFEFESGKIYGLLGRNGAGKTTFFNCLNEDIKKDEGTCLLMDESGKQWELGLEDLGYVLSTPMVPDFMTGRELVSFFLDINKKKIQDVKPVDWYLDLVALQEDSRDLLIKDYSHGMKNKMMMLLTIIANPSVWMLDEPLTSFDVVVADEMKKLLRSLKGDRIIIFSTHVMELATSLCDEIVLLQHGKLSKVEKGSETMEEFEEKIIELLKEGGTE